MFSCEVNVGKHDKDILTMEQHSEFSQKVGFIVYRSGQEVFSEDLNCVFDIEIVYSYIYCFLCDYLQNYANLLMSDVT